MAELQLELGISEFGRGGYKFEKSPLRDRRPGEESHFTSYSFMLDLFLTSPAIQATPAIMSALTEVPKTKLKVGILGATGKSCPPNPVH